MPGRCHLIPPTPTPTPSLYFRFTAWLARVEVVPETKDRMEFLRATKISSDWPPESLSFGRLPISTFPQLWIPESAGMWRVASTIGIAFALRSHGEVR